MENKKNVIGNFNAWQMTHKHLFEKQKKKQKL